MLNFMLAPVIVLGVLGGRWLTVQLSQKLFDALLLAFAAVAALRLIGF
jgi:uncharacterized membrane protein YfcA